LDIVSLLAQSPGLLKLDLLCKGARVRDKELLLSSTKPMIRTRAGLGSGVDIILPSGFYINVPIMEPFCLKSPYEIVNRRSEWFLEHENGPSFLISLPPDPRWYNQMTSSGKPMSRIGVLQGTYLAIYPAEICNNWTSNPKCNCRFCSVGLNLGEEEEISKSVSDVVEVAIAAQEESKTTYIHFNTGYYRDEDYFGRLAPYIEAVKNETGMLIGVQIPPAKDLRDYDQFRRSGVNQISFCFEFWNLDILLKMCPGKATRVGLDRYLEAIEYCADIFDTANGEIIAGIEPIDSTIEAIEWITGAGAIPTVCVFRPLLGSDASDIPSPATEDMIPIFEALYDKCIEHDLPFGIAPNIKVGMVITPEECATLSPDRSFNFWKTVKRLAMAASFRTLFYVKMRRIFKRRRNAHILNVPGSYNGKVKTNR